MKEQEAPQRARSLTLNLYHKVVAQVEYKKWESARKVRSPIRATSGIWTEDVPAKARVLASGITLNRSDCQRQFNRSVERKLIYTYCHAGVFSLFPKDILEQLRGSVSNQRLIDEIIRRLNKNRQAQNAVDVIERFNRFSHNCKRIETSKPRRLLCFIKSDVLFQLCPSKQGLRFQMEVGPK